MKNAFCSLSKTASLFAIFLLTCFSCKEKGRMENITPVLVLRYEQALMHIDTANLKPELQSLSNRFPLYLQGADWDDTLNLIRIRNFIEDPVVEIAFAKIQTQYPDNAELGRKLACIFERIRKYFPGFKNPTVYTYISYFDFANRILFLDSALSIAIDLYINGNEKQMDEIGVPRYMSRKLNAAHLEPDVARVLGASLIRPQERSSLLDYIVFEGKVLYFMEQVLPETKTEYLLGYDKEQVLWCKAHEADVWQYIVQQNLLFETNPVKFRHFVNEGPFNPLLEGAPARLCQFTGWRMIQAYMKKNNNDWQRLLHEKPQDILRISGYKP